MTKSKAITIYFLSLADFQSAYIASRDSVTRDLGIRLLGIQSPCPNIKVRRFSNGLSIQLVSFWSLYYKTLQIHEVWQMDKFLGKLVFYIVSRKSTSFGKHTCLLRNLYIMNPLYIYYSDPWTASIFITAWIDQFLND